MALASNCSLQRIPIPDVFGVKIISFQASLVQNFSVFVPEAFYPNHGAIDAENLSFCNVTVSHTHPGQNDKITTQVWLPTETWNHRMQGIGGAEWIDGLSSVSLTAMAGAVAEGYVGLMTDGGHPPNKNSGRDPLDWMMLSPGNVNMAALQNLASVSLNDAAVIGKSLAEGFYGRAPAYSYWSGCSEGGRQGLMLAQRYPKAFDGIAASAPFLPQFAVAGFWPQQIMNEMRVWPRACELNALTAAAIKACDNHDGIVDGIISSPESCKFSPAELVDTTIDCTDTGTIVRISPAAAAVANAAWSGAGALSTDDSFIWFGSNHEAPLAGDLGLANTACHANGTCYGKPFPFINDWIRLFVHKDPTFDTSQMTREEFKRTFHDSVKEYAGIIGTNDPDLDDFRDRGGKLMMYHGLADGIVPPQSSRHYYDAVAARDPTVQSYFRLFEAPGLGHCYGGVGVYPSRLFDSLVGWVERGTAPQVLEASSMSDEKFSRVLCPYPQRAHYGHGVTNSSGSFYCINSR